MFVRVPKSKSDLLNSIWYRVTDLMRTESIPYWNLMNAERTNWDSFQPSSTRDVLSRRWRWVSHFLRLFKRFFDTLTCLYHLLQITMKDGFDRMIDSKARALSYDSSMSRNMLEACICAHTKRVLSIFTYINATGPLSVLDYCITMIVYSPEVERRHLIKSWYYIKEALLISHAPGTSSALPCSWQRILTRGIFEELALHESSTCN